MPGGDPRTGSAFGISLRPGTFRLVLSSGKVASAVQRLFTVVYRARPLAFTLSHSQAFTGSIVCFVCIVYRRATLCRGGSRLNPPVFSPHSL